MKLQEGFDKLVKYEKKPLKDILTADQLTQLRGPDKGQSGKLIEKLIGLSNTTKTLDFEDGELKTNKCDKDGTPQETIAITQFTNPDVLLNPCTFIETAVYKKLANVVYVFICKDGDVNDWFIHTVKHVDFTAPEHADILQQMRDDYYHICNTADTHIAADVNNTLHTLNGQYLQVRTKDSKPYHPMYSEKYQREVSDKGRAFYLQRHFLQTIQRL